jgi:[ribosomal protein S5]-alanine N-acetyltransferase
MVISHATTERKGVSIRSEQRATVTTSDWRDGLPIIAGSTFSLRELSLEDAPALLAMLTSEEVSRFISPPPITVRGFEQFIIWAQYERSAGNYACFAIVPDGMQTAVGLIQLRSMEPGFGLAEWGFALGSPYWGNGMFIEGARKVVDFAVDVLGTHRLEARATVISGRGNGALRKIGAVPEGILRQSFECNGRYHDQVLWGLLASDWQLQRLAQQPTRLIN